MTSGGQEADRRTAKSIARLQRQLASTSPEEERQTALPPDKPSKVRWILFILAAAAVACGVFLIATTLIRQQQVLQATVGFGRLSDEDLASSDGDAQDYLSMLANAAREYFPTNRDERLYEVRLQRLSIDLERLKLQVPTDLPADDAAWLRDEIERWQESVLYILTDNRGEYLIQNAHKLLTSIVSRLYERANGVTGVRP